MCSLSHPKQAGLIIGMIFLVWKVVKRRIPGSMAFYPNEGMHSHADSSFINTKVIDSIHYQGM